MFYSNNRKSHKEVIQRAIAMQEKMNIFRINLVLKNKSCLDQSSKYKLIKNKHKIIKLNKNYHQY